MRGAKARYYSYTQVGVLSLILNHRLEHGVKNNALLRDSMQYTRDQCFLAAIDSDSITLD